MDGYNSFVDRMGSFDMSLNDLDDQPLAHTGVKGMRWGIRKKYDQANNFVGPRVAVKKKLSDDEIKKKYAERLKTKNNLESLSKSIKSTNEYIKNTGKPKPADLSNVSDADLKKLVERLNLEARYNALTPPTVSKGREYLQATLDVVGSAVAVTSSAVALAITISSLKKN